MLHESDECQTIYGALREALEHNWLAAARPEQRAPAGDWHTWLVLAGRGFGKTRTGAEWVRENVCGSTPLARGRYRKIALVAETAADARDVLIGDGQEEGSGLLHVHPKDFRPIYESSKRRLTWPNGAIASIYNGTEPDQLRGPQHDAAWCDELAKWQYGQETWDQLQFGLRIGKQPRVVITTTPRPISLLKMIIADVGTVITRGKTSDNLANLAPGFVSSIMRRYEGTRLGRQELSAELLEDVQGALWIRDNIDANRRKPEEVPHLRRIVIGIDPAVTSSEDSDETGIIAGGIDDNKHIYILEDGSGKYTPTEWARKAIAIYRNRNADRIIAEVNNGGDMVEHTLRMVDSQIPYKKIHASRGKAIRAEPVSALYEQNRVHHVGHFPVLEDQMCGFVPGESRGRTSPDRMDALVWVCSELGVRREAPVAVFGRYGTGGGSTGSRRGDYINSLSPEQAVAQGYISLESAIARGLIKPKRTVNPDEHQG